MAHGHDAQAIPHYSLDKLRLFYETAQARLVRAHAQEDQRSLRLMRTAIASVMDNESLNHYKNTDAMLTRLCAADAGQPANQKATINSVAQRLTRMGAKRIHGRIN